MTTAILEGTRVQPYLSLERRVQLLEERSRGIWKKTHDNHLHEWTPLRLYHLLTSEYGMPNDSAKTLQGLMGKQSLNVELLAGMVDEEIEIEFGNGIFTEEMRVYVSHALLNYILKAPYSKTAKALRNEVRSRQGKLSK